MAGAAGGRSVAAAARRLGLAALVAVSVLEVRFALHMCISTTS